MTALHSAPPDAPHSATPRPSACPGLLRIVAARDGGICRIKLPGGRLDARKARAIADAARRHAGGTLELTNRANLQIRGVRASHEAVLSDALLRAGLGPEAAVGSHSETDVATADDLRNLMLSPAAGRDPDAIFDTTGLIAPLLERLQNEARFAALSPKFALLIDGGERLAALDHPHDLWLTATRDVPDAQDVRFAFGLAGCPPIEGDDRPASVALATVAPDQAPALVGALLHAFLDLTAPGDTRMRDVLAAHTAAAVLERAQRHLGFALPPDPSLAAWRRARADAALRFGARPQRASGTWQVGGQPPLGRLDAATLEALATLAETAGNATLRLTPWQGVLLPDVATRAVPDVLTRLNALGLVCEANAPLARLVACTGSAGCAKGLADTKADALRLAARLPAGVEAHLSGCARSCAAAHCAPWTLLATAPDRYDLYRRMTDGQDGFGRCLARGLPLDEAADALARLARSFPDD
ncbi:precorrin-3B synthase [Burkholderia sp. WAC0059]|uniref:precorrin-3B synthase n=1 Tax=Burkholderia sp. WAC0059 TaxID=2066022 RepID=UPI000C7F66E5|nr:precorrin-3B synthase [Burkholderia sp. WAC0059]PLZ03841.1 precorrin-3B synthase [Burkholderia sp. WAC0059]